MRQSEEYHLELFSPADWPIDDDEAYSVFNAERRRFVISCLHKHETALSLADIADELASWEHSAPLTEIPAEDVRRIYLDLYHCHIPKLEDAELIEYRQEADMVALSAPAKEFLGE